MTDYRYIVERFGDNDYRSCSFGDCCWRTFDPKDGTPAWFQDAEETIEGEFKNIDGVWYFCYNRAGEDNYLHVAGRQFVCVLTKFEYDCD